MVFSGGRFTLGALALATLWSTALSTRAATNLQYTTGSPGLLNCGRDAQSAADCDPDGYHLLLTVMAAPGIAGAILVVLCLLLYFLFKYVCNCCGGRHQHPNFCCPNNSLPAKYSKADLMRPRIYAVVVFVLLLGGCSWGCAAATHVRTQLHTFRTSAEDTIQALQTVASGASSSFQTVVTSDSRLTDLFAADETDSRGQFTLSSEAVADELQRMANETVVPFTQYFSRYLWSVYVVFILLVIGSVVGLCAAFCHVRLYVPMILVLFFGLFGGVGAWGVYGASVVGERLFADVCHEVDAYVSGRSTVLVAAVTCNETLLASLPQALQGALGVVASSACDGLWPLCYQSALTALQNAAQAKTFDCQSWGLTSRAACNVDQLATIATLQQVNAIWSDTTALTLAQTYGAVCQGDGATLSASTCTIEACAKDCVQSASSGVLSTTADTARRVLTLANATRTIQQELLRVAQISVISDCDSVLQQVVPPLQGPCSTGTHSIYVVRQAAGFMALVSILAMGTYMIGAKRFVPLNQALQPQYG